MKQDLMHKDVNDVNITPEERRSIWQLWRQNLKDWAWYIRENPDWLDLDIQTAVKRHVIAPLREGWHRLRSLAHQKKRREFPESENRLAQLLLFAWGSMPRMGAGLRERFALRRKHNIRRSGSIRGLLERLHLHPAIFLGTCVTAAAVIVLLSVYTIGTTVRYDGINLGTVGSRRTVDQAVQQLETVTRQTLEDQDYAIDTALLSTQTHVVPRRDLESREEFAENLTDQIGDVTYGYTLYVDGEAVAATTYAGAIDQLLEQMKAGYITENTVDCSFVENVEIKEGYVDSSLISNLGYIAEKLNATKEGAVVYTVKPGDVWSAIAEDNGMTNQQLLTLNPGYDIAVLHAGDQLTISNAVPYLTVVAVERQNYIRDLPYTITYRDDASMYQGDTKVLSKGVYGKADVTANVTIINGEETAREYVASVTLSQPVAEVQARGTKVRPTWFPTGSFRWPCYGVITSYFGPRRASVAGASTYHEALDIANSYGTAIYAADGGTVTLSGWYGGLGYCVKIDHGNGFVTTYGHNSSLLVSVGVGEHVYKGQQIARMGSTGISSGPHCHFAVTRNGTLVDPLNYLP